MKICKRCGVREIRLGENVCNTCRIEMLEKEVHDLCLKYGNAQEVPLGNPNKNRGFKISDETGETLILSNTTIRNIAKKCHQIAKSKGWWDEPRHAAECLMLIVTEVAEAMEVTRDPTVFGTEYNEKFGEELADVVIRVFDLAEHLQINIEKAIVKKCLKNAQRPYRHGNKRA
jgi:NTP pyrophosphatase (non-canonical NTP hydrolase)